MDDWRDKAVIAMIPVVIAGAGWVLSLESRIQVIDARQQERSSRFSHVEGMLSSLSKTVSDPAPKAETKVLMEGLRRDQDLLREEHARLVERFNNLHAYMIQVPISRPPYFNGKRGDIFGTPLVYPYR